jgi:phosphatidylglycerophosphate synthase
MAGFSGLVPDSATVQSVQAVVVWEPGAAENPLRQVGGLTLIERILRQFSHLDTIKSIVVLKPAAVVLPPASGRVTKPLECYSVSGTKFWEILREARGKLAGDFIAVAADFLIDQRLLAWLAMQTKEVRLTSREGGSAEPAARLTSKTLGAAAPQSADLKQVAVSSLPSYWKAMHGEVPLHLYQVTDEASAEAGWKILLDHVQKRTLELPAQYFDPTFENLLIRRLAGTRVTANQVTLVTALLGFVVAALYYAGWLRVGVLIAIFVEVLDGVDGKLARITCTTSRAGEYEHILDFFYENSCYLALGLHLRHGGSPHALKAALLMILFDLTDNVAYSLMDVRLGLSLDNASPFLARLRLIAGRRNIYNWLFLVGFFLGFPNHAFFVAVVWAGITAAIHGGWVLSRALSRPVLSSSASRS